MATSRHLIDAAEFFKEISIDSLAKAVSESNYENPQFEMSRLMSLQQTLKVEFEKRDNMDPDFEAALYKLAESYYDNEEQLQTNVDQLELPFDMAESDKEDGGTWAHAWVWVPNEDIKYEVNRVQEERKLKLLEEKDQH